MNHLFIHSFIHSFNVILSVSIFVCLPVWVADNDLLDKEDRQSVNKLISPDYLINYY